MSTAARDDKDFNGADQAALGRIVDALEGAGDVANADGYKDFGLEFWALADRVRDRALRVVGLSLLGA